MASSTDERNYTFYVCLIEYLHPIKWEISGLAGNLSFQVALGQLTETYFNPQAT